MSQKTCGDLVMETATKSYLNSIGLDNKPHALVFPVFLRKPEFCLIIPDAHHIIHFYKYRKQQVGFEMITSDLQKCLHLFLDCRSVM